jgi:APA family basic amino acid/polyamine antiporter
LLSAPFAFESATGGVTATGSLFDLPALIIALLMTTLLVVGIRDSARFNNVMVVLKVSIVLFVIIMGGTLVKLENLSPFAPYGWDGVALFGHSVNGQSTPEGNAMGMLAGSAIVFFGQYCK